MAPALSPEENMLAAAASTPSPQSQHDSNTSQKRGQAPPQEEVPFKHSWSVGLIFFILSLFSFISALDGTIVTTALPTIAHDIGGNDQLYLWVAQCFFFATTVPQPLYGQIANIFGRRNPFLVAIVLFALGSGLSGGATGPTMLITGRTIQGIGAAGLYVLSDIIICDIVPPRHRGPYLGVVLSSAGVGSTIGPILGGVLAEANWRWIFYLNLPISLIGLIAMVLLLKVKYTRNPSWIYALKRVDFLGAGIFIPSMVAIFIGLITGGAQQSWSSWRTILPLILGLLGWLVFHLHQATPSLCPLPSMPPRLFTNRTSATGLILTFLASVILQAMMFFLPLYFQTAKLVSPLLSGVYCLPFALVIIPMAGFTGWFLSQYGLYIPLHYCGFALLAIGAGLFSTLDAASSRAAWIGFQIMPSAGIGLVFTATLPSTLAPLMEADVAVATATYSFIRSFGFVWGVTIAGVVFDGQINANVDLIQDEGVRALLVNGAAYKFAANGTGLNGVTDETTKAQITEVYVKALRIVWLVVMALSLLGFVLVPVERRIKLRKTHETEFGLQEKKDKTEGTATTKETKISSHV